MMQLAGLDLSDDCLLELVTRLRRAGFEDQADRIVAALMGMQTEAALTPPDRVAILTVLDDPPPFRLAELRATLLQEHSAA
jgi:hypothetical protein